MKELLLLVRSALENRPLCGPDFDRLGQWSPAVWDRMLEQAKVQSVLGLVYQAVSLLPAGAPVPDDVIFKLIAEGEAISSSSRTMDSAARACVERMRSHGLHPRVMKGAETARFYPRPLLRGYGDIDLYIPEKEVGEAASWARGSGYSVHRDADGSLHFDFEGIDVDVHPRYYDLFRSRVLLPEPFSPEGTLLMLSAHALKHAVGAGIGLRQLCDVGAALRSLDGRYDPAAYLDACRSAGILRWTRLLHRFLEVYLGVPDRLFPENRISPEPLLELIREGGNFGHYAHSRETVVLGDSSLRRKLDTALRFVRRIPFSFRYAPRTALARIWELFRGNLRQGMGRP